MKLRSWGMILSAGAALGCGDGALDTGGATAGEEPVDRTEQFLLWSPSSTILAEHTAWHSCGNPGSRTCPESGKQFLEFHRDFLRRLRAEGQAAGLSAADMQPWFTIPSSVQAATFCDFFNIDFALDNISKMQSPSTGERFDSLEAFGSYVESVVHNNLHNCAAEVWPADSIVGNIGASPSSTYFFKIHGWVEWQFQRFQRGDFNDDGYSDVLMRNTSTGANQIIMMEGASQTSFTNITTLVPGSCGWYAGATPDLTFDGNPDIVWHGPACSRTILWPMSASLVKGSTVELTGAGTSRQLIGTGDFNRDMLPDLAWRKTSNNDVEIWLMNGSTRLSTHTVDVPAEYTPVATAERWPALPASGTMPYGGGITDIVMWRLVSGNREYRWLNVNDGIVAGGTTNMSFTTPTTASLGGIGRFQDNGAIADLIFNNAVGGDLYYSLGLRDVATNSYSSNGGGFLAANTVIQGPR